MYRWTLSGSLHGTALGSIGHMMPEAMKSYAAVQRGVSQTSQNGVAVRECQENEHCATLACQSKHTTMSRSRLA